MRDERKKERELARERPNTPSRPLDRPLPRHAAEETGRSPVSPLLRSQFNPIVSAQSGDKIYIEIKFNNSARGNVDARKVHTIEIHHNAIDAAGHDEGSGAQRVAFSNTLQSPILWRTNQYKVPHCPSSEPPRSTTLRE